MNNHNLRIQSSIEMKFAPLASRNPLLASKCFLPCYSYDQGEGKSPRKVFVNRSSNMSLYLWSTDMKQTFSNSSCFGDHGDFPFSTFLHCVTSVQKFMDFTLILTHYVFGLALTYGILADPVKCTWSLIVYHPSLMYSWHITLYDHLIHERTTLPVCFIHQYLIISSGFKSVG